MSKISRDIIRARRSIEELIGKRLGVRVNEGRNKIIAFDCIVDAVYDGIFTLSDITNGVVRSYPYSALITHNVKFYHNDNE